jgi:AraC-like DNA-binding protein
MGSDVPTRRYFGADCALFVGPLPPPSIHSHHVLQGSVALEGSLRVEVGLGAPVEARGALIAPDAPHAVAAPGLVAHFYVLPESPVGERIARSLSGRPAMELETQALTPVCRLLLGSPNGRVFQRCLSALIDVALAGAPPGSPRDPRVSIVAEHLRHRRANAPLPALARQVGLSADRLRHLFRAQLGVPLRRYRRWVRLLHALEVLRDGGSVGEAAHRAGFADSAHFCRVFRESFTFPPSQFVRNSRFVQAEARSRS